jgi:hypothetical protein
MLEVIFSINRPEISRFLKQYRSLIGKSMKKVFAGAHEQGILTPPAYRNVLTSLKGTR